MKIAQIPTQHNLNHMVAESKKVREANTVKSNDWPKIKRTYTYKKSGQL